MTKKDYESYEFALSSAKTISDYKYLHTSQTESDSALTMVSKADDVKITLIHYDTISRNSNDGGWPSIVINFSEKQHFRLRPLFLAYEDRAIIVRLIAESFERLACAASISMEREITSSQLWEQVDAFTTDSVPNNLEMEKMVPQTNGSNHIPYHILCKSYTVGKLNKSNLYVLRKLEKSVSLREKFESISPTLKPFFVARLLLSNLESPHC